MPTSYNGCPASENPSAIGVDAEFYVPWNGAKILFPGGVGQNDDWRAIMRYYITQFFNRVEEPYSTNYAVAGFWGYEYRQNVNNPSSLSCHSSGTACDINAVLHPNGKSGTFSSKQYQEIGKIISEVDYTITVGCPGLTYNGVLVGWTTSSTPDEMHAEATRYEPDKWKSVAASLGDGGDDDMALSDDDKKWIKDTVNQVIDDRIKTHFGEQAVSNPNAALNAGVMKRINSTDNAKFAGVSGYKKQ